MGRGEAARQPQPVAADIEIRLFGEVRVLRGSQTVGPGTRTARTVLAMLASSIPEVVGRERLIDAVWGEDPPRSAVNSLQAHLSRLRDVVEPERAKSDASVIVAAGGGYRLLLPPAATDVGRFRTAVAGAVSAGDWGQALQLVEGLPLAGCADTWPVQVERRALEEERLGAIEKWVQAQVAEGNSAAVIGALERLVAGHPLREQLWTSLVAALHAAGRRSDALDAYQRARDVLVGTAGVEPGPRLQMAQRAVLEADTVLATAPLPQRAMRTIPTARIALVGREDEANDVSDLLERWRLLTITGPGGAGKTQLATTVARSVAGRFPGGGVFVDLTSAHEADDVLAAVASAVGVRLVGEHSRFTAAIADQLGADRTLLLLDNCEHVLNEAARLIDGLLDQVEPLTVLATSRAPLGVGGERVVRLGPLRAEDAAELFVQRAEARQTGVGRAASPERVAELCDRLDGLPLAIELAAARADHLSVDEILESVEATVEPLRRLDPHAPEDRHRSLTATIGWSYELLDDRLRAVLRHLSVFRGWFDRDQAAAVVGGQVAPGQVDDALGQLVGHCLLTVDRTASTTTYRLLETIAAFARAELEAHGETEAASRRHRDWYVAWARRVPAGETTLDLERAYGLQRHHADLVAALDHADGYGDVQELADLAVFAGGLTFCPAGLPDAVRWLARARQRAARGKVVERSDLLGMVSIVGMLRDDIETSLALAQDVVPLVDEAPAGVGPSAIALAMGFPEVADEFAEVADRLLATHGDALRPGLRLELQAMRPMATLYATGDRELALRQAAGAWNGQPWSDRRTMAAWTVHAALLHVCGQHDELRRRLRAMERLDAGTGPSTYFAAVFDALAAAVAGDPDTALAHMRRTREQHWHGIPGVASELIGTLAAVAAIGGDEDRARELLAVPDLRPRHPGTAIVHVWYRGVLGLPIAEFLTDWWGRGLSDELLATLDDELQR